MGWNKVRGMPTFLGGPDEAMHLQEEIWVPKVSTGTTEELQATHPTSPTSCRGVALVVSAHGVPILLPLPCVHTWYLRLSHEWRNLSCRVVPTWLLQMLTLSFF